MAITTANAITGKQHPLRAAKRTCPFLIRTLLHGVSGQSRFAYITAAAVCAGSLVLCQGCQTAPGAVLDFGPPFNDLIGILLFAALGTLLYRLLARRSNTGPEHGSITQAQSIVRERYARGEITQEEYDRMLRNLSSHK